MLQPTLDGPAAIYIRRSRDDQSSYSPEAQERIARQFCETNGLSASLRYFDDDYSGTNGERPSFQRLKADARLRRFRTVIVPKMDRFARDVILCLQTYDELRALGVRVWSVAEPLDFDTPMGRKFLTDAASTAEWYSRNLSTEVKKGLYEKAERGGWIGLPPYGYQAQHDYDRRGERVRGSDCLVPSDDADTVRLIFALYATGSHSDSSLRDTLNERGLTIFHPKTGQRVPFQRDSIGGILRNPAYIGVVRCGGQQYDGAHAPLIDRDLWDRCQAIRARRTHQHGGKVPTRGQGGLLSEIAYCGQCGARLRWWMSGNKAGRQGYYRCATRAAYGKQGCDLPMILGRRIEALVLRQVSQLDIPDHWRDRVIFEVNRRCIARAQPANPDRDRLQRQLDRLKADWRAGDPDLTEETYRAERRKLEGLLSDDVPGYQVEFNVPKALQLLRDAPTLLAGASVTVQRGILQQLMEVIWLEKEKVTAIKPSPLLLPLLVAVDRLGMTSTGIEPSPERSVFWVRFAVPVA